MDAHRTVLAQGVVYVNKGVINAVQNAADAPPAGFENVRVIDTGGTIYPGMIELHNHLNYNCIGLWNVPDTYRDRTTWQGDPTYVQQVSAPMGVLGNRSRFLPAIARYAECKCIVAGVTTSQGSGFKAPRVVHYYKGIMRNVESPHDGKLPAALGHVPDLAARDFAKFASTLQRHKTVLLHLCEGLPADVHEHFTDLHRPDGTWLITPALTSIHCVGLFDADFRTLKDHGASMVWSPFSNYLLYGQTANIAAAKAAHLTISLGSDWAPSGSKNLLGELKVARLASAYEAERTHSASPVFSDQELVEMVTCNPAQILKWQDRLGTIERNKYADLLVVEGDTKAPYAQLIEAQETDVVLVTIGGVRRYGLRNHMTGLPTGTEPVNIDNKARTLNLAVTKDDEVIGSTTLAQALNLLSDGLTNLPLVAAQPENFRAEAGKRQFTLVLDQAEPPGAALQTYFSHPEERFQAMHLELRARAQPLPLVPLSLDPLTAANDPDFIGKIVGERNLPGSIKQGLAVLYG
jgi:cytosine/adenosine deaminase-related metal-dependent hydrolase